MEDPTPPLDTNEGVWGLKTCLLGPKSMAVAQKIGISTWVARSGSGNMDTKTRGLPSEKKNDRHRPRAKGGIASAVGCRGADRDGGSFLDVLDVPQLAPEPGCCLRHILNHPRLSPDSRMAAVSWMCWTFLSWLLNLAAASAIF